MTHLRRREPIVRIPGVIVGLFAIMAAAQVAQSFISPDEIARLLAQLAFVPGRFTEAFDPRGVAAAVGALPAGPRDVALFFLGEGNAQAWSVLTYAFIHAGWAHLLANSVWLIAFGAPVARRMGSLRFLMLFCAACVGGALAHWLTHPFGFEPVVGASAGVSGVMAAAARFVFQPGGPIGPPLGEETARSPRALSVVECFRDPRALAFIIIWFVVNLVIGLAAGPLGISAEPIAWEAHIGGFFVGLILFSFLDSTGGTAGEGGAAGEDGAQAEQAGG